MGECVTEGYPSGWNGPETIRSLVRLHWGSFSALAALEPAFDWREQIWETLTHELRHHLESLADRDDLCGVDYAMEQEFRRHDGLEFDPAYYRHGDRIGPGVFAVEETVYIEQTWTAADFLRASHLRFYWAGCGFCVDRPKELGDIHFLRILPGPVPSPYLELVLVRAFTWRERIANRLAGKDVEVFESDAETKRVRTARMKNFPQAAVYVYRSLEALGRAGATLERRAARASRSPEAIQTENSTAMPRFPKSCVPLVLVVLAATSSSCASSAASDGSPSSPAPRRTSVRVAGQRPIDITNEAGVGIRLLAAPAQAAWQALPAIFEQLGIAVEYVDRANMAVGTSGYLARRIGGDRMNTFVDCGNDLSGPLANQYDVTLSVRGQLRPRDPRAPSSRPSWTDTRARAP